MLKHWKRTLAPLGVVAATGLVCAAVALGGKKPAPPPPPPPQPTISYSITFLGTAGQAMDLNNLGEVVGCANADPLVPQAFVVVPEDTDGDGLPDLWYRDADGDEINVLMVLLNDLIDPNSGRDLWIAYGINDAGQIVGQGHLNGQHRAYRFTPGVDGAWAVVDNLGTLGGDSSASAINHQGEVAGSSTDANGAERGFVWTEQDGMRDIGSLVQGGRTEARGINNSGQVTGFSYIFTYTPHAFLYTADGGMEDLGYFAPTRKNQTWRSLGLDINDNGHVAGWAGVHAFLYTDHMIDLGTLGGDPADRSEAYGLNGWDEVVGLSGPSSTVPGTTDLHGFLYTNKTNTGGFVMFKLQERIFDLPGDFQAAIIPRRINHDGVICGTAGTASWVSRDGVAIVLTPVSP